MKKILIWIVIIFFFLTIGFFIGRSYSNLDINNIEQLETSVKYTYVSVSPLSLDYDYNIEVNGVVELGGDYFENIDIECDSDSDNVTLEFKQGDLFSKGDVICSKDANGKQVVTQCNGIIDRIEYEGNYIHLTILNRDKLYYTMYVDYDDLDKISYSSEVYYRDDEENIIKCDVRYIGSEIDENNQVKIEVVGGGDILPGMSETFYFVVENNIEGLFLPAEAVNIKNTHAFVLMKDEDGNYNEKEISIGESVEVEENGSLYTYYEILGGLDTDDTVYIEKAASNIENNVKEVIEE